MLGGNGPVGGPGLPGLGGGQANLPPGFENLIKKK
jgi:signal recognition particle subunit SRP54